MPFLIRGAVPTQAIGDCPWCGKKDTTLHLLAAMIDGKLGADYVCAKCLVSLDALREENRKNGKIILGANPEVMISEAD